MNEKIAAELQLPGVGLGAGVAVGCLCACFSEPHVRFVWMIVSAAVLALSLIMRKRQFLAAGLLLGILSMTAYQTCYAVPLEALSGSETRAVCRVVSVNHSSDRWSAGRALCFLDGKPALISITCGSTLETGDILDAEIHLEKAEQSIFTFSDGIVLSGDVTEIHSRSENFSLLYHFGKLRSAAAQRFDSLGGDEAELCRGLILGIRDGFSMQLQSDILRSGVSYMTAVSGAHITIFIAVLCELFGRRRRKQTAVISIAAVLLMMAMFGFSASVVRSGIMLILTQGAVLFLRQTDTLNSLCVAMLAMTLFTPFAAADPSLQMSVLGVFGAAIAGPALNSLRRFGWERHIVPAKLKEAAAVSLCAMICVLPVSASVFGGFSLVEVPASVALAPFFSAGLPLGVFYAVSGIPMLEIPLRAVMSCFRGILRSFGELDGAWVPCGNRFAVMAALMAPVLLMIFIFVGDHARKALGAFLLDVVLILCLCFSDMAVRQRIDFVSDGRSGAAVVCRGKSAAVMISGSTACTEQLFRLMTREGITHVDMINAPQLEFSELTRLEKLLGVIPADTVMLPDECRSAAEDCRLSKMTKLRTAEEVMEINGTTIACAKTGSDIRADIGLYYGYKLTAPETSVKYALYASSRQNVLPDGAVNIHDETFRIEL